MVTQWSDMTPEENNLLHSASKSLSLYIERAQSFREGMGPASDSPWLSDQSLAFAKDGQSIAAVGLQLAEFYQETVIRLIGVGLDPVSPYALLRGAGEAAARAWWVLDPTASSGSRRDRGLTERVYSFQERLKVFSDASDKARMDGLIQSAEAAGIRVVRQGKEIVGFGERRLSGTDLFEKIVRGLAIGTSNGSGEFIYRLLSGYAHAVPWPVLAEASRVPSGSPDMSVVGIELNVRVMLTAMGVVRAMYMAAQERYVQLHGRGAEWRDLFEGPDH